MGFADLHVHSQFSDGCYSPQEIVKRAQRAGVTFLAVADHDVVEGSLAIKPLCEQAGIRYISAVEHCCLYNGCYFHVLSYGADLGDAKFLKVVKRARAALDWMSDALIERMSEDFPEITVKDYQAFERDLSLGGWKGIAYLVKRGVTKDVYQAMGMYGKYDVFYRDGDFPSLRETIDCIHEAGGKAVLAHPGESFREPLVEFECTVKEILDQGMDGIECYYPKHGLEIRDLCLRLCEEKGLVVTSGSDCHGSFSGGEIGCMRVTEEQMGL